MIIYREWITQKPTGNTWGDKQPYKWQGWFLFGYVPLYIKRNGS